MDDLQIHSFTKRSARDAGDFRTVSRTIERNFERQLLRAANTKSEVPTANPRNVSKLHTNRDAAPKAKDRIASCRNEENDAPTEQTPLATAAPSPPKEAEVKNREAKRVETQVEVTEKQSIELTDAEVVAEGQFVESETEVTASEAAEISTSTKQSVVGHSTSANAIPDFDELSHVEADTSNPQDKALGISVTSSVDVEDSSEGQSTNSEVAVEETKSGETLALNSNRATLEESASDAGAQVVHQVAAEAGTVSAAGANVAMKLSRSVGTRENGKVESKRGGSDQVTVTASAEEGHLQIQKLTDSATAEALIRVEDQPVTEPIASERVAKEPHVESKGDATDFFQRLVSGRTAIGPRGEALGTDGEPRVDVARFVGRVAGAFRAANERGGVLQLRLSPPELGSMKLELIVEQGTLTARIEAETTTARKVLLDNLPALRDRLAQQEIRIERFDVDVRRDGTGGQPDWQAGDRQERQFQNAPRQGLRLTPTRVEAALESERSQREIVDGRLNVIA